MYVIPKKLLPHEIEEQEKRKLELQMLEDQRRAQAQVKKIFTAPEEVFAQIPISSSLVSSVPPGYQLLRVWRNTSIKALPLTPVWMVWHGTSIANVEGVSQRGLTTKRSNGHCLFGAGIYLTRDINKAMSYAHRGGQPIQVLLHCQVSMGKMLPAHLWTRETKIGFGPQFEWNSVFCPAGSQLGHAWGGSVVNEELVIYDDRQVQVQDIYLLRMSSLLPEEPLPPKQRIGKKRAFVQRREMKNRKSQKDHIARHHLCVSKDGVPCVYAQLVFNQHQKTWVSKCKRWERWVSDAGNVSINKSHLYIGRNCKSRSD